MPWTPKAKRKAWNGFFPGAVSGHMKSQYLDFNLLASRTGRK
jgi:hypothetical protein